MPAVKDPPTSGHDRIADIHDVEPVTDRDHECLREVRDVLKKHKQLNRLGVALLHTHFAVSEDEMLVEETDVANRTQIIRPIKADRAGQTIQTIWQLGETDNVPLLGCRQYCGKDVQGNHNSFHSQTRSEPLLEPAV